MQQVRLWVKAAREILAGMCRHFTAFSPVLILLKIHILAWTHSQWGKIFPSKKILRYYLKKADYLKSQQILLRPLMRYFSLKL